VRDVHGEDVLNVRSYIPLLSSLAVVSRYLA
jgi:hypothetical protein